MQKKPQLDHQSIPVYLRPVETMLNAKLLMRLHHAHVFKILLAHPQIVGQNVLVIQNVRRIRRVSIESVGTRARDLAVLAPSAESSVILLCVFA